MDEIMEAILSTKRCMNELIDVILDAAMQGDIDLDRNALLFEFEAIGTYTSAADNDISNEEINLFNILFDTSFTPDDMPDLISIVGEMHKQITNDLQMPGWALCKVLDESIGNNDVTDLYIATMNTLMQCFAAIDGETDSKEERFINDFVRRLRMDRL